MKMIIFAAIWKRAVGLLLLILVNIVIGSCDAWISGKFNWKTFFRGVIKGAVIATCIMAVYLAGYLVPDIYITFNGDNVTLMSAMTIFLIAAYTAYAVTILKKFYSLFKLDTSGEGTGSADGFAELSEPLKAAQTVPPR